MRVISRNALDLFRPRALPAQGPAGIDPTQLRAFLSKAVLPNVKIDASTNAATVPCAPRAAAAELCDLINAQQPGAALERALELRDSGLTMRELCLDVLAPSARLMGEGWVDDTLDFTQVTLGVGHLRRIMHEVRLLRPERHANNGHHHTIALLPTPGEQHTFGLSMLGDFFQHAGWQVIGGPAFGTDHLIETLKTGTVDCVGISVSDERFVEQTTRLISDVRNANGNIAVLVGGYLANKESGFANLVKADGSACDAASATETAATLVQERLPSH